MILSTKFHRGLLSTSVLALLATGVGCGGGGGGGGRTSSASTAVTTSGTATTTSSTTAGTTSSTTVVATSVQPAPDVVPVICVHGHGGDPETFLPYLERYAGGRAQVAELEAAEADALKPGDLPRDAVVVASYYREKKGGALYDPDASGQGTGSIGGCPTPRNDSRAGRYPVSYAGRLARIVEGVRRATGSDRVDLVLHSMGNLVGRAYTRWLSDGALGGKSKVRRILCVAGPQRGINALEAMIDGLDNAPTKEREFMIMGENAEMCYEFKGWQGRSFIDRLNDGWDTFCQTADVRYGGMTAKGAYGKQVNPNPGTPVKALGIFKLSTPWSTVYSAITHVKAHLLGDLVPYIALTVPRLTSEYSEAMGPGDGTVRFESSRMDQAPFGRAEFWVPFEARHSGEWNAEQSAPGTTVTAELARQFFTGAGTINRSVTAAKADLRLVDAPGKASWIAVDTVAVGGNLTGLQLVEEKLDASGNPTGGAVGYGLAAPEGEQFAYAQVPAGGGARRYHLVAYGPDGPLVVKDKVAFTLTDGAIDLLPTTTFVDATPALTGQGPVVTATFASNTVAGDPSLRYSFRLDGGAWTAYGTSASFATPALADGEHRLEARAKHARNAAAQPVEDAKGVAIGLVVKAGALTVRK